MFNSCFGFYIKVSDYLHNMYTSISFHLTFAIAVNFTCTFKSHYNFQVTFKIVKKLLYTYPRN